MRTFVGVVLGLIGGYVAGALTGFALVSLLSANAHDRSMEATMTGAFVTGPLGTLTGVAAGVLWLRRRHGDAASPREVNDGPEHLR